MLKQRTLNPRTLPLRPIPGCGTLAPVAPPVASWDPRKIWPAAPEILTRRVSGQAPERQSMAMSLFPAKRVSERKFPVGSLLLSQCCQCCQCCRCHRFLLVLPSALCPDNGQSTTGGTQAESAREHPAASHSVWLCRFGLARSPRLAPPTTGDWRQATSLRTSPSASSASSSTSLCFSLTRSSYSRTETRLDLNLDFDFVASLSPPPPPSSPATHKVPRPK
jgi:hypothetical protein